MAGRKQNMTPMWKKLMKLVDLDETNFVSWRRILGMHSTHWRDQDCLHKSGCDARKPYWRFFGISTWIEICQIHGQDSRGAAYKKIMQLQDLKIWCLKCGSMSKAAQKKEKHEWAIEEPKIEKARRWWGIYFIDPEDGEYRETIKIARKKWRFRCRRWCFA